MKIFSGSSNPALVDKICANLSISRGKIILKSFASGEVFCQFEENIRGADVYLVQSTSYPANDNLMELMIMADAARRASAGRITAVIPYFGYARQDRKEKSRVPISAKLVMDIIKAAGFNRILTMDLHAPQIGGFTNLPFDHLNFMPALLDRLKELPIDVVVCPDVGAVKRNNEYANAMRKTMAILDKHRIDETNVEHGVVNDQRRVGDEGQKVFRHGGEQRLVRQKFRRQTMHIEGFLRHVALWIKVDMEGLPGRHAIDHLDAADLDQPIAAERIEACRFGVENDFTHGLTGLRIRSVVAAS